MLKRLLAVFFIAFLAACNAPASPATPVIISTAAAPLAVQAAKPMAMGMNVSLFNLSVAQYSLDSAGFHEMAATLADKKSIDAVYFNTVNQVQKVLVATVWPAELNSQAKELITSLNELGAALKANNVEDAIRTSDVVHDAQHEFSFAIDTWIAAAKPDKGTANPFNVSVAQYLLDSAGFHEMAATLAERKSIDVTYFGRINRVEKILVHTAWPNELDPQVQALITELNDLGAALEANNVDAAIQTSDVVHDAQHELSYAIDDWMKSAKADSMAVGPFQISAAQYLLDTSGFHEIAVTLAESKTIDETYFGTINQVEKILVQTAWPNELNPQVQALIHSLNTVGTALEANNVEDAIQASDVVQNAQHEFSQAIDHWITRNGHSAQ